MSRSPPRVGASVVGLQGTGCSLQHASYCRTSDPYRVARRSCPRAESTGRSELLQRITTVEREGAALPVAETLQSLARVPPPGPRPPTSPAAIRHLLRGTPKGGRPRISACTAQNKGTKPWGTGGPGIAEGRHAPFPVFPASSRAGLITP